MSASGSTKSRLKIASEIMRDSTGKVTPMHRTLHHPADTAAMGKVADSSPCVYGVQASRVVDASTLPLPISGHYQAYINALAEQAADLIADSFSSRTVESYVRSLRLSVEGQHSGPIFFLLVCK